MNRISDWFLRPAERGNPSTVLDARHADAVAWSMDNHVRPLVHGAVYFRELLTAVEAMEAGDTLLFTDWRGDPDQQLDGPGTDVGTVFAGAAARGVRVSGLVWRSHLDRFQFSASENRHLGAEIEAAGGQCLLDMRVRPMGSHHQKLVVLRHPHHPERDVAFIGGIDLCHSRRDDAQHNGDPQPQPMAAAYGSRPPWHDIQLAVRGPAVGDAETVFRERWEDPSPLSRNPFALLGERLRSQDRTARPLGRQLPDPPAAGTQAVQLLRTYPARRFGYPFAPDGERSVARGYAKAMSRARSLIYVEDQYLWSAEVVGIFAEALKREPSLRLIAVIPGLPDQDGRLSRPPNLAAREPALRLLRQAGGPRFGIYWLENQAGTPIYVHAKVCVVDDIWSSVGSDNVNRRSWTHDSELSCAVLDLDETNRASPTWGRSLRRELSEEHLGRALSDEEADDSIRTFDLFAECAHDLEAWHRSGRSAPRPPGQLRPYTQQSQPPRTRRWADPMSRLLYDPDGRSRRMRRGHAF